MYLAATHFPDWLLGAGWLVCALLAIHAVRVVRWQALINAPFFKVYPGFVVGILVLWLLKAGVIEGLSVHLLGLTAFTLMFGAELAFLGTLAVYLLLAAKGSLALASVGLNALLIGVVPIVFTSAFHQWMKRLAPKNVFSFIFLSAYLNAALGLLFTVLLLAGFLWASGSQPADLLTSNLLRITPMLMLPEGFLNGGVAAVLVMFRPHWVAAYDDNFYLKPES